MIIRKFLVSKKDIAYLKYIFEGYEGMATLTTLDSKASIIEMSICPDFVDDVEELCYALKNEIDIREFNE